MSAKLRLLEACLLAVAGYHERMSRVHVQRQVRLDPKIEAATAAAAIRADMSWNAWVQAALALAVGLPVPESPERTPKRKARRRKP